MKTLEGAELDGPPPLRRLSTIETPHPTSRLTRRASLDDLEQESCRLTPKVENRIVILDSEEVSNKITKDISQTCLKYGAKYSIALS